MSEQKEKNMPEEKLPETKLPESASVSEDAALSALADAILAILSPPAPRAARRRRPRIRRNPVRSASRI